MKISAVMIVKNEESCLATCLGSLKGIDEIIICDTGSEDNTVAIAGAFTDKVFTDYKWNDNFAEARNHALAKATGDWVLTIDADEYLVPGSLEKIREAIENTDQTMFNINVQSKHHGDIHHSPRVHRRIPEIFWQGAIHNYMNVTATEYIDATIVYGYSEAHKKDPDRALRILTKEVERNPKAIREKYYLAREYWYRRDYATALGWYMQYLAVANWAPEMADGWLMKARCLWALHRGEEARNACLMAIKINADFKEALLFMAELSGPKNRERWITFAEMAEEEDVLFKRRRPGVGPDYYQKLNPDSTRYQAIYEKVQDIVGEFTPVIDIGCGKNAPLKKYFDNYDGFDYTDNPIRKADAYDKKNYPIRPWYTFICLEVLEHLDDIKVVKNIPHGRTFVFSVPSFLCEDHIRVYSAKSIKWRFRHYFKSCMIIRFNWHGGRWVEGGEKTADCIYLCEATIK